MPRSDPPAADGAGSAGVAGSSSVGSHWFESAAEHMGAAYLRYSFTRGTDQEVAFLVDELGLTPGERVLDVGCGPGRHALALAERGMRVTGVDISATFVDLATDAAARGGLDATFVRADARALDFDGEFDAVISLCQGAFGLQGRTGRTGRTGVPPWSAVDGDAVVLAGIARALRSGGRAAVSAFSAYFQVRYLEETDDFDAATGVNHETTELRDAQGRVIGHDLWTTCFTPRELVLLAERVGLEATAVHSVTPGRYRDDPPVTTTPEFLLVAVKS